MKDLPLFPGVEGLWKSRILEGSSTDARGTLGCPSAAEPAPVVPLVTSKTSELFCWGGGRFVPQKMEMFDQERKPLQVSVGHSHSAMVTAEKELYTWSNVVGQSGTRGQLGHGDRAAYKAPKRVEFEEVTAVERVFCGDDFTVCLTDSRQLYFFGSNEFGCSGSEGEVDDVVVCPSRMTSLDDLQVEGVSCGSRHVVVLVLSGDVYTWGCGEYGCLGHGDEENRSTPQKVDLLCQPRIRVVRVHAGSDRSIVLTEGGLAFACGSNEFNKLGFNHSMAGVSLRSEESKRETCEIQQSVTFELLRSLKRYRIVDASSGLDHTVFLDWLGHVITAGNNRYGQLGVGDLRPRQGISLVGGALAGQKVNKVACGDWFTVAATEENMVFSWGLGEHGRLGNAVPGLTHSSIVSSLSSSHQKMVTSFPRPVFGSLHEVSDLSCRHWNAAIIAEKVLMQKTVASFSLSSSSGSSAKADPSNNSGQSPNMSSSSSLSFQTTQGTVPDWLKAEIEFADKLDDPTSRVSVRVDSDVNSVDPATAVTGWCGSGTPSERFPTDDLVVEELREENRCLRNRVAEQEDDIKRLRDALETLHRCL